jgi:SusD family.
MKSKAIYTVTIFYFLTVTSCKKFVEVDTPQNQLTRSTVFKSDKTANAALLAIYSQMAGGGLSYNYLSLYPGLLADELVDFTAQNSNIELYTNGVLRNNSAISEAWQAMYKFIYEANAIIEGVNASTNLSSNIRKQIRGEALFTRALIYFYLINYFGDVPFITNTNYKENESLPRSSNTEIYTAIISDLLEAKDLLNANYTDADGLSPITERLRPNKSAVTALLARIYLYLKNYDKANEMSTDVINNGDYHLENNLDAVFLRNSQEAIWQLSNGPAFNTFEGLIYVLYSYPGYADLNPYLVNIFSTNDLRKSQWIGTYLEGTDTFYFPNKYKVQYSTDVTEYVMVLRLAEQYLIRSEARANLDDINGANQDLNIIRNRAGLPDTLIATKNELMDAILKERQRELFTEWGHRWFDLKRTGQVDAVMAKITPYKGGTWQLYKALMPVPQDEILKNRRLNQNSGY